MKRPSEQPPEQRGDLTHPSRLDIISFYLDRMNAVKFTDPIWRYWFLDLWRILTGRYRSSLISFRDDDPKIIRLLESLRSEKKSGRRKHD